MAEEKKCIECGKEVKYRNSPNAFECDAKPGAHTLPTKKYFHPGGQTVQSLRDRRLFGPHIILRAGREKMNDDGTRTLIPGIEVNFLSGRYETSNAEEQYYLDILERDGKLCDEKRWDEIYLLPEQRLAKANDQLAELDRKIQEKNSLLESAKAKAKV